MAKKNLPIKANQHPFQVGGSYGNHDGKYEVISIDEPNMVIRYEDGRTIESSIGLQKRIWENLQDGDDVEVELD